jgi:hypothetical protein
MKLFRRYVPESLKRIIVNVTATHQGNYQWIETGIFFFSRAWSIYKAIGKFINDGLTNRPEITYGMLVILTDGFRSISKIITNKILV